MAQDMDQYGKACQTPFWQAVFEAEAGYLAHHLQGCTDVLSVGCGPATVEGMLNRRGFRITGLDISQEALRQAPAGIRTVAGRAEAMPFSDHVFDAAVFIASLQFVEDYAAAIDESARVIKPGGRLIVMLINPTSDFFQARMQDPNSYMRQMKQAGCQILENAVARRFAVATEFFMGVTREGSVVESRDPGQAALYVIRGVKPRDLRL